MSRPLLPERAIEAFLEKIRSELEGYWLDQHGHCAPYRYARSGISGVRSKNFNAGRGGRTWHVAQDAQGVEENVSATPTEDLASRRDVERIRTAGEKIKQAMEALDYARALLSPKDTRGQLDEGIPLAKHERVRKDEWLKAQALQFDRQQRGGGYGDS